MYAAAQVEQPLVSACHGSGTALSPKHTSILFHTDISFKTWICHVFFLGLHDIVRPGGWYCTPPFR